MTTASKENDTEQEALATATPPSVLRFIPRNSFPVKVGFPALYPETVENPFTFHMRVQLNKDAQAMQEKFLGMPDDEQTPSEYYLYNLQMIAMLSTTPPEGFPDFPTEFNGESLESVIRHYLMRDDKDEAEGMAMICQAVMNKYWYSLRSPDYL
jgi:hypothetical protein